MTVTVQNGTDHLTNLTTFLREEQYAFLQPTFDHQQAALAAAKAILDPLAQDVVQAQTARRAENRRKRKRGSSEVEDPGLQLKQVYTKGLGVKQVWEQARRVLDAACNEVERAIQEQEIQFEQNIHTRVPNGKAVKDYASDEHVEEDEMLDFDGEDDLEAETDFDSEDADLEQNPEEIEDIEDDSDVMSEQAEDIDLEPQSTYKPDPNNLNDGFFSIDDFNKQSQFLEQMDARGDDDNPSDEDEIDWDADPLAHTSGTLQNNNKGRDRQVAAQEESEDEDDGPTFGNADLTAADNSDNDSKDIDEGELDGMMAGLSNTNEIRYADFFEPPPKKPSKSKRTRALPKTQPPAERPQVNRNEDEEAADLERAMADVKRDLLDSEDEVSGEEDEDVEISDDDDALPRLPASKVQNKNLSTHEKQKLQIAEEIRRLESLNVSKKPWTLSGEASAGARPLNSLIEEDLEFERTGKPVPVITAEVTNDIESLIKRRILARDFDETVRRSPTTTSAADARRGRADAVVDDTKPTAGLGEIYESEYQRNADSASYVDKRSAATKKQHEEIDRLWKDVRDQLDVLANLHIKPKRAEIEIKTVEDKPRIAMEDARPAVSGAGIEEDGTMLAPQEIYKPGTDSRAEKGEVLSTKTGVSRNKEELTREEKTRKRRRDKERQKKAGFSKQKAADDGKRGRVSRKAEQEGVLKDLQKGGVKVIGKGGQLQDLTTKKKKGDVAAVSGSALKL